MAKVFGVLVAALLAWGSAAHADEPGRWQQLENNPRCYVWNLNPQPDHTVTWSGACGSGHAQGRGVQVWRYLEDGEWKETKYTGEMKGGLRHGRGVLENADHGRYEGDFKDGVPNGRGVWEFADHGRYHCRQGCRRHDRWT